VTEPCSTKQELAASLKTLLCRKALSKISVGELCAQCQMSRKSFYYHFRDKYDLVIWIFETEFMAPLSTADLHSTWDFLLRLCEYFQKNQLFYRRALEPNGQNSLEEYLRTLIHSILSQLAPADADDTRLQFYAHFYSDAFLSSVRRWLNSKPPLDAQSFVSLFHSCVTIPADPSVRDSSVFEICR